MSGFIYVEVNRINSIVGRDFQHKWSHGSSLAVISLLGLALVEGPVGVGFSISQINCSMNVCACAF